MEMTGKIVGSIKVHTRTYKVREVVSLSDEAFGDLMGENKAILDAIVKRRWK